MKIRTPVWWIIIAVACLVYTIGITHEGIWYDEACSAIMARHPLVKIITLTAYDNHPPLYYLLLGVTRTILGNSVWALRSLSVAGAVALVCLGAGPVRRIFGNKTALIYAAVILFTPATLIYAHEARMYTLAIFAVTASVLYGYLAVQDHRTLDWVCFGVATLAAAYLHYYGLIAAFSTQLFVFLWLLLKKREILKAYLITGAAVVAGYLPWLGVLARQTVGVSKGFWLSPVTFGDIMAAFYKPFAYKEFYPGIRPSMDAALGLALILIICGVAFAIKRKAKTELTLSLFLLFVYLGTLLTTIIVSLVIAPIFYARYMLVCVGLFLLLVSLGIRSLPGKYLPLAALGIFMILNVLTLKDVYTQQFNFFTKDLVQDLGNEIKPGDLIITSDSYSMGPAMYYFPQAVHYYSNNSREARFAHVLKPFIPPLHYEEGLKDLLSTRQSFWYITANTGLSKSIWTILKGEPGWEAYLEPKTYSEPYSPVKFTAQKYIYTGQENTHRGTLNVNITGLKPKGALFAILYDKESPFWTGPLSKIAPPYRYEYVTVDNEEMLYTFDGLDYGEYVLVFAQDENENHEIDFDRQGRLPVEGMFILNYEKMDLSSGLKDFSFDKLKFTFHEPEKTIEVKMMYPPFTWLGASTPSP
jgi:uncharacterized membrane protein/uncharacterized protein (DUF2141 family)